LTFNQNCEKMKVLYVRVSSVIGQNTDRQKIKEKEFDLVVEDKCSGSIPFFEREGGKKIKQLIDKKILTSLSVWTIDRMGRDLLDVLHTIQFLSEKGIRIHFIQQGLISLDDEGKENPISKMIISILGIVAEMERKQIKERQREGIQLAKLRGVYKGRVHGSKEDIRSFLSKPKVAKTIDYLKKGYKASEISRIVGIHVNTITKVKKMVNL
jgi:DNA invertase Pin-like site-specific DNA recombinase